MGTVYTKVITFKYAIHKWRLSRFLHSLGHARNTFKRERDREREKERETERERKRKRERVEEKRKREMN